MSGKSSRNSLRESLYCRVTFEYGQNAALETTRTSARRTLRARPFRPFAYLHLILM